MAEAGHLVTARNINSISSSFNRSAPKSATQTFKIKASSKRNDISLVNTFSFSSFRFLQTSIFKHSSLFYLSKQFYLSTVPYLMMERKTWLGLSNFWLLLLFCYTINVSRKYSSSYSSFPSQDFFVLMKRRSNKTSRRLITISTSGSRWQGKWTCDYLLSLQDLNLEDLVEDEHKNAHVFINLCIEKHASFGFTVDGKINTSFTRKCCTCSLPYCREINANFNVLVLSSNRANREIHLPDIGGDDPSVIYVKPGLEADLDSLVRDTIRLNTSIKDTCSELCEKSQPTVQYIGAQNAASIDKRWSRLLELRKSNA